MSNQQINYVLIGTLHADQPLATCSKDLLDREGVKNKPVPVPSTQTALGKRLMFPATGVRGTLRRTARDIVRTAVSEITGEEKPFSLDQHYFLTLGGIKGAGEQVRASVAHEEEWRRKNPLLSMYGAGDAGDLGFVTGRLSVSNAICREASEPVVLGSGARTDDLYRDKSQIAYLSDQDIMSLVRQAEGGKDRSNIQADIKKLEAELKTARRAGKTDEAEALAGKIDAAKEQVKQVKEATGTSDVSIGMPLAGWQAIPQGSVMDHSMHLMRSNPVELGLLLHSLARLSQHPFIGAHYAAGCGQISGQWEIFEATLNGKVSLGTVACNPFDALQVNGAALTAAMTAFDDFMQSKEWDFNIPKVQ